MAIKNHLSQNHYFLNLSEFPLSLCCPNYIFLKFHYFLPLLFLLLIWFAQSFHLVVPSHSHLLPSGLFYSHFHRHLLSWVRLDQELLFCAKLPINNNFFNLNLFPFKLVFSPIDYIVYRLPTSILHILLFNKNSLFYLLKFLDFS